MGEISSGLVAHIAEFKEALNGTKGDLDAWLECNDESEVRQAIFGVISDAKAIISAKDAEILEQCRINGIGVEREAALLGKVAQQSSALKMARSALMHDGYPCGNGCKCRACEALAAINEVLKGD